jgi:hypothetical protein
MQLREIDKSRYRKHLNQVFVAIVVAMVIISISTSTVFIHFLSQPDEKYFIHNLAGVIIAGVIVILLLNRFRHHPFMTEVVYVWDLKQILNRIYRKQRKIEKALLTNNHEAMLLMNFQYRGSKQLYKLDDNEITLAELNEKIRVNDERMLAAGLESKPVYFDPELIKQF